MELSLTHNPARGGLNPIVHRSLVIRQYPQRGGIGRVGYMKRSARVTGAEPMSITGLICRAGCPICNSYPGTLMSIVAGSGCPGFI